MRRLSYAVLAVTVLLVCILAGLISPPLNVPATAVASETEPAPGQLSIVNDKGEITGMCPLRHTAVQADISGFVSRVTVKQQFHNPSKEPIEAVYTFPLPGDAAVDDMTMTIGKRIVKAQIKRREEARQIYEAAKAAGQGAALLDQERPNIFTQAVANIMPGEEVAITISYVNLLKYDEGRYEWVFPMVVGPRYTPTGGYSTPGQRGAPSTGEKSSDTNAVVTDAEKITPPIALPGTRAGHDISVIVNLDAGLPLKDVSSQLHAVDVSRNGGGRATIHLRDADTRPNKDFILRYTVAGPELQTGVLASAPRAGDGYFTLILQPPVTPPDARIVPKEIIFVIDQTGSQAGLPIRKAKETMRYLVQNMNPGDSFQLLGFNTSVFPCFTAPVHNTPENVSRALKFLEPIEGAGGTDILKAVEYALTIPADAGRQRIVCYLTDGYVGNDLQILDYVQKNRGRAHMFPFGIGNSVNRTLIDGMAKEGLGVPEYVDLKESGEVAAARFYRRIAQPLLTDIKVEWNGLPVQDVLPRQIPDLFVAGRPTILKGRYTAAAEGDVTLSGRMNGQAWSRTVRVKLPATAGTGTTAMPTIWAREKIEELQAQDWMGAQTRNPNESIREQIIAVALEYRLMSQWTSFVAVEQRVVNIGGKQRLVDVPVEMPEGVSYEGIFGAPARPPVLSSMRMRGSFQASAGYAGGVGATGAPGPQGPAGPPATLALPAPSGPQRLFKGALADGDESVAERAAYRDIAEDTEAGRKRLESMKPEERRVLLAKAKLAPVLIGLDEKVEKLGKNGNLNQDGLPKVTDGKIEVQIWLNKLPPDGLAKLKALGFELAATLTKDRLILGTIPLKKLEALTAQPFVRRVEPPAFN